MELSLLGYVVLLLKDLEIPPKYLGLGMAVVLVAGVIAVAGVSRKSKMS